jgi:hypothetical protein
MRVTNGNPLGSPLLLPVDTANYVATLKGFLGNFSELHAVTYHVYSWLSKKNYDFAMPIDNALRDGESWYPPMVKALAPTAQVWAGAVRGFGFDRNLHSRMLLDSTHEQASMRVTNGIPLRCPNVLPVCTITRVQTLKAKMVLSVGARTAVVAASFKMGPPLTNQSVALTPLCHGMQMTSGCGPCLGSTST